MLASSSSKCCMSCLASPNSGGGNVFPPLMLMMMGSALWSWGFVRQPSAAAPGVLSEMIVLPPNHCLLPFPAVLFQGRTGGEAWGSCPFAAVASLARGRSEAPIPCKRGLQTPDERKPKKSLNPKPYYVWSRKQFCAAKTLLNPEPGPFPGLETSKYLWLRYA